MRDEAIYEKQIEGEPMGGGGGEWGDGRGGSSVK